MQLRRLTAKDEMAFLKAVEGFPDEPRFKFIPSFDPSDMSFDEVLNKLSDFEGGANLPSGFVPDSLLFAFDEEGVIVGRCSIRHQLNDFLSKYAGHIGYGVLPEFRRRGYASEILKQALEFSRSDLGLQRVLVTCDDNNIGSIKTIEGNGYTDFTIYNDEKLNVPKRHYWISLD